VLEGGGKSDRVLLPLWGARQAETRVRTADAGGAECAKSRAVVTRGATLDEVGQKGVDRVRVERDALSMRRWEERLVRTRRVCGGAAIPKDYLSYPGIVRTMPHL
jgi:hypothetical protein